MKNFLILLLVYCSISGFVYSQTNSDKIENKRDTYSAIRKNALEKEQPNSQNDITLLINEIEKEIKQQKSVNDSLKTVFNEKLDLKNLYTLQIGFIAVVAAIVVIALPFIQYRINTRKIRRLVKKSKEFETQYFNL